MNLDFGILWIEDSFSVEEEESLKRRVKDAGFIARIKQIPSGLGIESLAREHSLYHVFDIILLDYRLLDDDGAVLATKVRQLFPSTTILFYSGTVQESELRRLIAENEVEGVYCSRRDQLRFIQRAGDLIDQTARALDRLSGMRGLAMRVVAECDELMKAAMVTMCAMDEVCSAKVQELDDEVFKSLTQLHASYTATVAGDLTGRFASRAVDSAKLFSHFRRLTQVATKNPAAFGLNADRLDRLRELRNGSSQYVQEVLKKRNVLGHAVERRGPEGWVLEGSDDISISDFPEIRRMFATYIDAIREMKSLFVALDKQ